MVRIIPLLLLLLSALPAAAQDPIQAVHAERWSDAQAIAASNPDPLAAKLVTYYRLLTPNAARVDEITAFMAANPDWPAQGLLEKRREEALANETDDALVRAECDRNLPNAPLAGAPALLRCADALEAGGRHDDATQFSARADAARAGAAPAPMLEQARAMRLAGQDEDALALWLQQGPNAQAEAPASRLPAYWNERQILARRLLRDGDDKGAYALVSAHGQTQAGQVVDAEFLAGYIALRRLNQPDAAAKHFQALADASHAVITQGRAWYWLGRAAAAAGRDPKPFYLKAADYPTSFYGQLASVALGEDAETLSRRINAVKDPGFSQKQVGYFAGRELARAAALLAGWSEPHRAHAFLLRLDELSPDPSDRALTARYALGLGMPEMAVFIARRMGRDGVALPEAGWPMPVDPPTAPAQVDPAVALGLMRQESSFDVGVVSPAGARGLMQLMPATAQVVARQLGEGTSPAALTRDPDQNMRLGTAYFAGLMDRFGGALPFAAAGYNAGPNRVDSWLAENGDPRVTSQGTGPGIDMIDWIELIPFGETRNYVQRVLENVAVYRAKRGETTPTLVAEWTK